MNNGLNLREGSGAIVKALLETTKQVHACGLDAKLVELVMVRASQLNGCAYCIDMHTKNARQAGETEQRLYSLNAWRTAPFFSDRERAALEWAEALTLVHEEEPEEELLARMRCHFSDPELVNLTLAVGVINAWNRITAVSNVVAGSYKAPAEAKAH